jgi:hypothetical protein
LSAVTAIGVSADVEGVDEAVPASVEALSVEASSRLVNTGLSSELFASGVVAVVVPVEGGVLLVVEGLEAGAWGVC